MSYPETIAEELSNIAKEFIESFHCKTFVSTLTRENNNLQQLIVTANNLLQHTLGYKETDSIVLITPDNLTDNRVLQPSDTKKRVTSSENRVTTTENYVPGVEVLYMNLHSPQLDKILHTYLKDDGDVTNGDVTCDDVTNDDVTKLARQPSAGCENGVETTV